MGKWARGIHSPIVGLANFGWKSTHSKKAIRSWPGVRRHQMTTSGRVGVMWWPKVRGCGNNQHAVRHCQPRRWDDMTSPTESEMTYRTSASSATLLWGAMPLPKHVLCPLLRVTAFFGRCSTRCHLDPSSQSAAPPPHEWRASPQPSPKPLESANFGRSVLCTLCV